MSNDNDVLNIFGQNYENVNPDVATVNPNTHEVQDVVDADRLKEEALLAAMNRTPMDSIRAIAEKHGIPLNNPKKNCKSCHGRGWFMIQRPGEVVDLPQACHCITKEHSKRMVNIQNQALALEIAKNNKKIKGA